MILKLECLNANLATEGFGPCKRASQANHGTIDITLGVAAQSAIIAITSHTPTHTRVKLICTDITNADIFTVRILAQNDFNFLF